MAGPKIPVEALAKSEDLRILDAEISQLLKHAHKPSEGCEKRLSHLPSNILRVRHPLFEPFEVSPRLEDAMNTIRQRPCSVMALRETWDLNFFAQEFETSLVRFASTVLDRDVQIRTHDAVSVSAVTGTVTSRYPSADQVSAGLPMLSSLIQTPIIEDLPVVSAMVFWFFLYRLHPLPDGNGRASRLLLNHALKNYGVLNQPMIFMAPVFFTNLRMVGNIIRSDFSDPHEAIYMFMLIIRKALELSDTKISQRSRTT